MVQYYFKYLNPKRNVLKHSYLLFGMFLLIAFVPLDSFAQSNDSQRFFSKGVITGEHFNGGVIWIGINGDDVTTIVQWDLGRSYYNAEIESHLECESDYPICIESKITHVKNSAAATIGDLFTIKIDPENKHAEIEGQKGFLENVTVEIDITKIYK